MSQITPALVDHADAIDFFDRSEPVPTGPSDRIFHLAIMGEIEICLTTGNAGYAMHQVFNVIGARLLLTSVCAIGAFPYR